MLRFVWSIGLACLLPACGPGDQAEVGFVLVRADEPAAAGAGLRATGLDREHVATAWCQVLDAAGQELEGQRAEVDPALASGEQSLRLKGIPAGEGYFARIRGLDAEGAVYECGASGPFALQRGAKALVTIVIAQPTEADPDCASLCTAHAECPTDQYCASPCARGATGGECTDALCRTDYSGQTCQLGDCPKPFSCLTESSGWPGGYCSASCTADDNCPGRSLCWTARSRCVRQCQDGAECRQADGYDCGDLGGGRTGCIPP